MKYAFVDYENLNSLDGLALQEYDRIFLFIGASNNQTEIRLTEKLSDEVNITLIKIKSVAKNNVDFHIAYYLGKLDAISDKTVEFYILSNDQGYDGICNFIQHKKQGRICQRKGVRLEKQSATQINNLGEINNIFQKYMQYMKKAEKRHLPVRFDGLKNSIRSHAGLAKENSKVAEKLVADVIEKLISEQQIKVIEDKVSYPKR
ncbi:PIN domain-containing protein [Histophilus somni]|uniref:PIN domain-containing protein n=1 Tax=Histophilus somni TaxID=731 RepID=UPI00201F62EF|nr:PIN domain-containing protein [Histophilus somni]